MEKKDDNKIPLPESTAGKIAYLALMLGAAIIADRLEARRKRKKAEYRRTELKEENRHYREGSNYKDCEIHGPHSEQCQAGSDYHTSPNRCIECHGGLGDGVSRWCMECDDDWEWYNGD